MSWSVPFDQAISADDTAAVASTAVVPCRWPDCGEVCTDDRGLVDHLARKHRGPKHGASNDGRFLCLWPGCETRPSLKYGLGGIKRHLFSEQHIISRILSELITYFAAHTASQPFQCFVKGCSRGFLTRAVMRKHLDSEHSKTPEEPSQAYEANEASEDDFDDFLTAAFNAPDSLADILLNEIDIDTELATGNVMDVPVISHEIQERQIEREMGECGSSKKWSPGDTFAAEDEPGKRCLEREIEADRPPVRRDVGTQTQPENGLRMEESVLHGEHNIVSSNVAADLSSSVGESDVQSMRILRAMRIPPNTFLQLHWAHVQTQSNLREAVEILDRVHLRLASTPARK